MKKAVSSWRLKLTSSFGIVFLLFAAASAGFVKIANEVTERETKVFDESVLNRVHDLANHTLDTLAVMTTDIGGWMVIVWGLLILGWLIYKNAWNKVIVLIAGLGGAEILNLMLKALFARPRPELWERLVVEQSFSFPSGHAMASSALAFVIMYILWDSKWRWWGVAGASLFMIFIGFTRLYLGVHYPTDIVAGWCVSGAWVGLVILLTKYFLRKRPSIASQSHAHDS